MIRQLVLPVERELKRASRKKKGAPDAALIEATESELQQVLTGVVHDVVEAWRKPSRQLAGASARRIALKLSGFRDRLDRTWRKTFRQLASLEVICFEAGAELSASSALIPTDNPVLRHVLLNLHARACKVFAEVRVLLQHGFADGAHARWRTLHETAVVANFLREHGEKAAKLYLEHETVESFRAADEYEKHASSLGYEPLESGVLDALRNEAERLEREYGGSFMTQYGWAAALLNKSRPGFPDLERTAQLDRMRPFYRMASHHVHANPKAFTFSLSQSQWPPRVRLAGPGNAGLGDPAHGAAISLSQVTAALFAEVATLDAIALMVLVAELTDDVGDSAIRSHTRLEEQIEIERAWKEYRPEVRAKRRRPKARRSRPH